LEVTESGVMADVAKAMETLTRLRLKGIVLSLDDFGTGYSSLVQLYQMPFSELKIDRAFVADLTRSEEAQTIVRSVIDLAHNLGMQVCAEGVEDPGAAEILRSWGCDRAQGFLFAPALPSAKLEAWLREQAGTAGQRTERMRWRSAPATTRRPDGRHPRRYRSWHDHRDAPSSASDRYRSCCPIGVRRSRVSCGHAVALALACIGMWRSSSASNTGKSIGLRR
jgi:hypothetical protein